ncbi:MAG: AAA family ATPase [Planctomycetia bacterium]
MRILSVHVQNYRVHRDCEVEFDAARTVVGGPNESGKSTLAEAIHRALFLRHSVGGTTHEAMRSAHGGGMPEVTLRFEAGGSTYTRH